MMLTPRTILVVEDNHVTRKSLRRALQAAGYSVIEAESAAAAFTIAERKAPDLALIDCALPDLDGRELAPRLRGVCGTRFPAIALAGAFQDAQSLLREGDPFDDVLVKPIDTTRLLDAVRAQLGETQSIEDAGKGVRVLLVQDSPLQLELNQTRLGRLGFEVAPVRTAREALVEMWKTRFDVVIADALMPEMDGFAFSAAVKSDAAISAVPIVLLAAQHLELKDRELARRAGVSAVVSSTLSVGELVEAALQAIDESPRAEAQPAEAAHRPDAAAESAALAVIRAIGDALSTSGDAAQVTAAALEHAVDRAGLSRAHVYGMDGTQPVLRGRAGPDAGVLSDAVLHFGHPELFALCVREQRPIAIPGPDLSEDVALEVLSRAGMAGSAMLAPLAGGVLFFASKAATLARTEWLQFGHDVARQLSTATAMAEALERMEASEARYRGLLQGAAEGIAVTDEQGRVVEANAQLLELFGVEAEQLLGRPFSDFVAPSSLRRMWSGLRGGSARGVDRQESVISLRADGTMIVLDLSASRVETDRGPLYVTVVRDATARSEVERDLAQRARRQESLARLARLALAETDFSRVAQAALTELVDQLELDMAGLVHLDGHGSHFHLGASAGWPEPLRDVGFSAAASGSQIGFTFATGETVIVPDVEVETQLAAPRALIEHGMKSAVTARIEGGSSPFGVLVAYSSRKRKVAKDGADFVQAIAGILGDAVRRGRATSEPVPRPTSLDAVLERIIDERARTGDVAERPVDLSRAIDWALARTRPAGAVAKVERSYGATPPVVASEARLGQAFAHLIDNAVEAVAERGGRVTVATSTAPDGSAVAEITDDGAGIPRELEPLLFTPFFTTHPTRPAAGLGLVISRRIVSDLGGTIELASEPGKGTRVRVSLPPAPSASAARRGRVLVIDDDPGITMVLRRALSHDHEVVEMNRARDALARIEAGEHFDVILCDVMMPGMGAVELHRELARVAPELVERMILLTGGAFTAEARRFLEQVPNPRVGKPFDIGALKALVAARVR